MPEITSETELAALRAEIDRCDREIISWASRRIEAARRIGQVKRAVGLPIRNLPRESEVRAHYAAADLESLAQVLIELAVLHE